MTRAALYRRLGFGFRRCPIPADVPGCVPGGAGGSMYTDRLGWRDRLRVLCSGWIVVDLVHQMDTIPRRFITSAQFSVPEPGWRGHPTCTTEFGDDR